jgi:hypothetical protein
MYSLSLHIMHEDCSSSSVVLNVPVYFLVTLRFRAVAYTGILFEGGSTNSVEDRENGDLGAVAP